MSNEEHPVHRLRPQHPRASGPDRMLSIRLRDAGMPHVIDCEATVVNPRKPTFLQRLASIGRKSWPF